MNPRHLLLTFVALGLFRAGQAQQPAPAEAWMVKDHYTKREVRIPMRDGVHLFTNVYVPGDASRSYPIMLVRTPYSVAPYGPEAYPRSLGPSPAFAREGFIFAYQDVRGRMMSEGEFVDMRPRRTGRSPTDVDESTDTYDTIDWLVKNLPDNNGRVGIWGISYPGFYAAQALLDSHPALKAASPQAPIADWFTGDDFHHNGAFFLFDAFDFFAGFGSPRPQPTSRFARGVAHDTPDPYEFFLRIGPLRNVNERYFHGRRAFWDQMQEHGTYDAFWQSRRYLPALKNIHAAVLTVGGLFDAEDLHGALKVYDSIEKQNPGIENRLVMGPWFHGGWASGEGSSLGDINFGWKTSEQYRAEVEFPFFMEHLKGRGGAALPEARMFDTGAHQWLALGSWPPAGVQPRPFYFHAGGRLSTEAPGRDEGADEYVSDPANPVPYQSEIAPRRSRTYMIDDQRFASRRPDVLDYQTEPLAQDLPAAGPVKVRLHVAGAGTDADFVVKLVDVFPDDAPNPVPNPGSVQMGGYQMLVRAEVMRAKFRNSCEKPEPLKPGKVTPIEFELRDVCHTFLKGHRVMAQVQSSWFPLVDRNPQRFTDIYHAAASDFRKATERVYHTRRYPSRLVLGIRP